MIGQTGLLSIDRLKILILLIKDYIAFEPCSYYNNTFIDKENQYDTNVSVIKIKVVYGIK